MMRLKRILILAKHRINAHPRLKYRLMLLLSNFPKLQTKLKSIGNTSFSTKFQPVYNYDTLSPQAKKIYDDLKKEIVKQQAGK